MLPEWNNLPPEMQTSEVKSYYLILQKKKGSLLVKRLFDIIAGLLLLLLLLPLLLIISLLIALDSPGGVFFRQERVTTGKKVFRIFKFRTMVKDADRLGAQITTSHDSRVTKIGSFLRHTKLDELPQLLNIITGDMTFVGTRPEVPRYVAAYTPEMLATLLLPAGVTSEASICYRDEAALIASAADVDQVYTTTILPAKMAYNLAAIKKLSCWNDLKIMFKTVWAVLH